LESEKCLEVCEHVIAECKRANCPLDLRLLDNGCSDFLLWDSGNSSCHWKDLVTTRVEQAAAHFRHEISTLSREERKARERDIVREILEQTDEPAERERIWEQKTGKRKSAYYVRKREVDCGEFDV
jgi:hypothetical protein